MRSSHNVRFAIVVSLFVLIVLLVAIPVLTADQYSAMAAGIQALAVVPAITVAALFLVTDSHDRRVDRVLEFHAQLTIGDVESARNRLVSHLRTRGRDGKVRPASREELRTDPTLSVYRGRNSAFSPFDDVNLVLRFFERVNAARIAGTVYLPLLVELVGRHAAWLDLAITREKDQVPREPMHSLATWANEFAQSNSQRYSYLANWGSNRAEDFTTEGALMP